MLLWWYVALRELRVIEWEGRGLLTESVVFVECTRPGGYHRRRDIFDAEYERVPFYVGCRRARATEEDGRSCHLYRRVTPTLSLLSSTKESA